jgi:hypothetical protein
MLLIHVQIHELEKILTKVETKLKRLTVANKKEVEKKNKKQTTEYMVARWNSEGQ